VTDDAYSPRRLVRNIAIVCVAIVIVWALYLAREALLLVYISGLLAIGLAPLVGLIERQKLLPIGSRRFPRWLAILSLYLVVISIVTGIGLMVVPPLVRQAADLWVRRAVMLDNVQTFLKDHGLITHPLTWGEAISQSPATPVDAVATVISTVSGVIGGLIGLVMILILTFYLLVESGTISETFVALFPEADRPRVGDASRQISRKVSAWLGGHLMLAGVMGGLSAIGLFLMGVPYFYVVALIAAAGEMVPILGPLIAGLSAVAVAATVSYKLAIAALVYFLVLHQLEANILVPKIMERQVGLSPVAVIIALMIGGELHGIPGAILAVPTTAILKVIVEELTHRNPITTANGVNRT
jgi:predicted PurR-regulated permease PerM